MSLEVFEKLEAKVQQAIDTITLLQMEIVKRVLGKGRDDADRVILSEKDFNI